MRIYSKYEQNENKVSDAAQKCFNKHRVMLTDGQSILDPSNTNAIFHHYPFSQGAALSFINLMVLDNWDYF